jgi:hypothetical protein
MGDTMTIGGRFCGPPGCGNGGYVCGSVAAHVKGNAAHVRLTAPVPLERPLDVVRHDDVVEIQSSGAVVARGRPAAQVGLEVPELPPEDEVVNAMGRFAGHTQHPFPTCFVCGPRREPGDGMRIFPGPVANLRLVASAWTVDASLAGADGSIDPVYVWASLDCPSGWAAIFLREQTMLVLGELTAQIDGVPRAGERCVALGWPLRRDNRKHYVGSALVSAETGQVFGRAEGLWISVGAS